MHCLRLCTIETLFPSFQRVIKNNGNTRESLGELETAVEALARLSVLKTKSPILVY